MRYMAFVENEVSISYRRVRGDASMQAGMRVFLLLVLGSAISIMCFVAVIASVSSGPHGRRVNGRSIARKPPSTTSSVSICLALSTRSMEHKDYSGMKASFFFSEMLTSLCNTISKDYTYYMYISYDNNDPILTSRRRSSFFGIFRSIVRKHCPVPLKLRVVKNKYSNKPAWSQNDALMAAYEEGVAYHYLVTPTTVFKTPDWTESFITTLQSMTPPNVGVVGPKGEHDDTPILNNNFIHKTHVDIFDYLYPRDFSGKFAYEWLTKIYLPDNSFTLDEYEVYYNPTETAKYEIETSSCHALYSTIAAGRALLIGWLKGTGAEVGSFGDSDSLDMSEDKLHCDSILSSTIKSMPATAPPTTTTTTKKTTLKPTTPSTTTTTTTQSTTTGSTTTVDPIPIKIKRYYHKKGKPRTINFHYD